jgi:hypothetical protein
MSNITIKQNDEEQAAIQRQLDAAMLPSVLNWNDENNIHMLGGYVRARYITNGVLDLSFGNLWTAIKALKDSLVWKVAPRKSSQSTITQDERSGKIIRDLRREKQERQEQEAQDARERSTKKTLEQRYEDANRKGAINLAWAACREYVASYPGGRTYGERERHKEALAQILKHYTARQNGNPSECMAALQAKVKALQDQPLFG